jgi:hypothetical protein
VQKIPVPQIGNIVNIARYIFTVQVYQKKCTIVIFTGLKTKIPKNDVNIYMLDFLDIKFYTILKGACPEN